MHQKRQRTTTKLPIPRKGSKFIVRALSDPNNSVPITIALRDMLKLAQNKNEVKKMIHNKLLKINGRSVKDYRESIGLFSVLEAGKTYILTISPRKKFVLEEAKQKDTRMCKVTGKKLYKNGRIQLNLQDGTNVLAKEKISIGDTVYLDFSNKIKKHVPFEKGKKAFIISGKYTGRSGKVESVEGKEVGLKLDDDNKTSINERQVVVYE